MRLKSVENDNMDISGDKTSKVEEVNNEETLKHRVLLISSRGISARQRHFLNDLAMLIPTSRKDNKIDSKSDLNIIGEIAELNDCSCMMYLESRKKEDLYMWICNSMTGPTLKFEVLNMHTMDELQFAGNFQLSAKPILSFDKTFDIKEGDDEKSKLLLLIKESLTKMFSVPTNYKKTKNGYDHVFQFSYLNDKIWFRNYQILNDDKHSLVEVGPRFTLDFIVSLENVFRGKVIYKNKDYVSKTRMNNTIKEMKINQYSQNQLSKIRSIHKSKFIEENQPIDQLKTIFK